MLNANFSITSAISWHSNKNIILSIINEHNSEMTNMEYNLTCILFVQN